MWCRYSRWIFFIPNRSKHLPAHSLVLTPLREISFLLQKSIKNPIKKQDKNNKNLGLGLAQNHLQADVLVLTPKLNPTSLTPFRFWPAFVTKNV